MNFIEMLYYGKFHPFEKIWSEGSDYRTQANKVIAYEEKIREALSSVADSEEIQSTFEQLMETRSVMTTLVEKEQFAEGFRLGVMCMVDSLVDLGDGER
ncbi:MAG: hypothetical protein R3Y63_09150 [Eubacteriales bacterium]